MARIHYWQYIVDEEGRPISNVKVDFYLAEDEDDTQYADIYTNVDVGHTTTTSESNLNLETDQEGYFEFWVGDEWENTGGYTSTQRFKLTWYKAGISRGTIDNIDLYPPLYQIDETLDGQTPSSESERRNKVISNALAYAWEQHIEKQIPYSPSADSPHNIQSVIVCSPDTTYNKVVSNELLNKIYTLAVSASTTSLDASAADVDFSDIPEDHPLVSAGGDLYYSIVNHNLPSGSCPGVSNSFPIVQVVDRLDNTLIIPETIQSIDVSNTKIVFSFSDPASAAAALFTVTTIG